MKKYMVELEKGHGYESKENSKKHSGTLADGPVTGGEEEAVYGEHSGAGARVHGVRRRARKTKDAQRVSEEPEEYPLTTWYLETTLVNSYC